MGQQQIEPAHCLCITIIISRRGQRVVCAGECEYEREIVCARDTGQSQRLSNRPIQLLPTPWLAQDRAPSSLT